MRRLSTFRRLARVVDREIWANLHGIPHPVRLYVLRNGSYLVNRRSPEPRLAALILAIMKTAKPRHFWDVGAHIGYYSWLVAAADSETTVVAIEPDPINLTMLHKSRVHAPRVDIAAVAASESEGTATFLTDRVSGATGTLEVKEFTFNQRNYGERPRPIEIQTRRLDSIGLERGFPDFVKMDVEGHEVRALAGGAKMLNRRPLIVIEIFDPASPAFEQLRMAGYHIFSADSLSPAQASDGNYLAIAESQLDLLAPLRAAYSRELLNAGLTSAA
jgi:FkbM family methyltransferase